MVRDVSRLAPQHHACGVRRGPGPARPTPGLRAGLGDLSPHCLNGQAQLKTGLGVLWPICV